MNVPFRVELAPILRQGSSGVRVGHYFVFVEEPRRRQKVTAATRRRRRLGLEAESVSRRILPAVDTPVQLSGVKIVPVRTAERVGCLVCGERRTDGGGEVVIFAAVVHPPRDVRLLLEANGTPIAERQLKFSRGVTTETFSQLVPGRYTASLLERGWRRIGEPVTFSVAEYTLAPLVARLLSHRLHRGDGTLVVELEVESDGQPFVGALRAALLEGDREFGRTTLAARSPGAFQGAFPVDGELPLHLRLVAVSDAARVAEIAIPGSGRDQRETTVVSELGEEKLLSLVTETAAQAFRGGFLSPGDSLRTPLAVPEVVTQRRVLEVRVDVESLVLVVLDLLSGESRVEERGNVPAGAEVVVGGSEAACLVVAGGFVAGRPFEGYTSFFAPPRLQLSVECPETVGSSEELTIGLRVRGGAARVPVFLRVRDERRSTADTPSVALGAALKRTIAQATAGMEASGFTALEALPDHREGAAGCEASPPALSGRREPVLAGAFPPRGGPAARESHPDTFFSGTVIVRGRGRVVVPTGSAPSSLAVEVFALSGGEWAEVTKAVRVEGTQGARDVDRVRTEERRPLEPHVKERVTLQKGETFRAEGSEVRLRLVPAWDASFGELGVTPDVRGATCERTASSVVAAAFLFLTARQERERRAAETMFTAGIRRLESMWMPGQGFADRPELRRASPFHTSYTVRYLGTLRGLECLVALPGDFRRSAEKARSLWQAASEVFGSGFPPGDIRSVDVAFAAAAEGKRSREVVEYLEAVIDFSGARVRVVDEGGPLLERTVLAYAAASLLALGDGTRGLRLARQAVEEFRANAPLRSKIGLEAAVAVLIQLGRLGVLASQELVRLDGSQRTVAAAAQAMKPFHTVEVLRGMATVEVTRRAGYPAEPRLGIEAVFEDGRGQPGERFRSGEAVDLVVRLAGEGRAGDRLYVDLPPGLARIEAGVRVHRFACDMGGRSEWRTPLLVTAPPAGREPVLLCVQNLLDQRRGSGPIEVPIAD